MLQFNIVGLHTATERANELRRLNDSAWPEYLLHGNVRGWSSLYTAWAEFQLLFLEQDTLVGAGLTVPFAWRPGTPTPETMDEVVFRARWPLDEGPGVLCALAALVVPGHRRRGLSRQIIRGMCSLAARHRLAGVLAPVRPTRKHEFPFEPIERYADRVDASGRP